MSYRILVINPGSTSTKIGVYEDEQLLFDKTLRHSAEDIAQFKTIAAQKDWRRDLVMRALREQGIDARTLSAVSGRGGLLRPIRGGTYAVNDNMVTDCTIGIQGQHASNLGGLIAREIGDELGIPSYIVDPVVIDEMADVARYAGHPLFQRVSIFHALNQKAVAKRFAKEQGKKYEELNLIVAHLGGGISASVHRHGEIIDSVGDDDGQFSPERSGCVPSLGLIKLCYSGKYTYEEMRKKIRGRGGMYAHLGTSDCRVIEQMIRDGDRHADLIFQAQAYQIAKAIGLLSIVLKGDCDAIILTGGVANSKMLTERVEDYVKFIAPVCVMPGENEMEALALGGMRILQGEENARIYHILNGVNGKEGQG